MDGMHSGWGDDHSGIEDSEGSAWDQSNDWNNRVCIAHILFSWQFKNFNFSLIIVVL